MRVSSRMVMTGTAIVAALLFFVALFGGWLSYQILQVHSTSAMVRTMARVTHFPVARLGSDWITYEEYLLQSDAQEKYLSGQEAKSLGLASASTPEMKQAVLDQLLRVAALEDLAKKNEFTVTPIDVDRSYDDLIARSGTSTKPGEIKDYLLENFGWTEQQFKAYIVRPAVIQTGLAQKRKDATGNEGALESEITARLAMPDVKRWLKLN